MSAQLIRRELLEDALRERVLVLDGAMGTMIETAGLDEADFRGLRFGEAPENLKGNHELLTLTRPDVIAKFHHDFLRAGADIITTNSFNANSARQSAFGLEGIVYELNLEAARLARFSADDVNAETPYWPRFVAGAIGPRLESSDVSDFLEPIRGLVDGGVDLLLMETVLDDQSVSHVLSAADEVFRDREYRLPIMISFTALDGRIPPAVPLAMIERLNKAEIWDIGFNCNLDIHTVLPGLNQVAEAFNGAVSVYPNARFDDGSVAEPEVFSELVSAMAGNAMVNVVGGCCGTTPAHIAQLARLVLDMRPRTCPRHVNTGPDENGGLAWAS